MAKEYGWICPRCGKSLAPWVKERGCPKGSIPFNEDPTAAFDPQFLNMPPGDPDWRAVARSTLKARRNGQNVAEVAL